MTAAISRKAFFPRAIGQLREKSSNVASLWDRDALAEKDAEIEAYLQRAGARLREACEHLVWEWRDS